MCLQSVALTICEKVMCGSGKIDSSEPQCNGAYSFIMVSTAPSVALGMHVVKEPVDFTSTLVNTYKLEIKFLIVYGV